MKVHSLLNSDPPAQPSSTPSARRPQQPAPPPLQPPQTPQTPQFPFQSGEYSHPHSQPQSPYFSSPTSATRQFPPPPPPSPHAQQQHHHQQQGYGQSPSTPHPLGAASRHSATPTSSVSSPSLNQFPPGQHHQYDHTQQQQQIPLLHQHQQHHNPPPSSHHYHSPHQQQHPHPHPNQGYPRQSPLASPIGGRPLLGRPSSNSISVNERSTPTITPPVPRDQRDKERERARENRGGAERKRIEGSERAGRGREQWEREQRDKEQRDRDRESERERERERRERREREIDISVSPKTKLPPYSPAEDAAPDSGGYVGSRSNSQHLPDGPGGYARRDSSVVATPSQERRSVDMMDLDGGSGVTPGPVLGPGQKWGSPVAERAKPNGAVSVDGRDSQGPHHLAPQQQQPQPTQPQPQLPSNPNSNSNPSQQPPSQPSSGASSQRTSTVSPSNKEQPHPPPSSLTLQTKKSTPTPTPAPPSINSRHPPPQPPSSPRATQQLGPPPAPSHNPTIVEGGNSGSPGSSGPPKKRARRDETPIWARKASRSSSSSPVLPNRRQPSSANQHQPPQQQQPPPLPPPPPPPQQHQRPPPASGSTPRCVPCFGAWEPSICNTEPYEELTREVANFLFSQVVCQNDPALAPSGGDGPVVMIEIEAKIGHLIDKEQGERLKLPVVTETVLNVDEPGWKIQFKSSMTEAQHKRLNLFLNRQFHESKGPPPPGMPPSPSSEHPNENSRPPTGPQRIPMDYVHTRERDTFFELPPDKFQALPNILRSHMRHKPKVRVTFDQTGKVINKIIKTRIADLNVYSPKTVFDWRVSANIEMPYPGDIDGLQPSSDRGGGDRNKDRLSYRHLAYQIDLTQVTDNTAKKEHELEVEVSGQEIIRHGNLVKESKPNAYVSLVRGFVDNVRVLIRAIEP
ncbi:unnamed protein product [Tuber aestivum]|uniref:mRNA-capping enzyme subunit beta n=1 Tax=Tuber aestivum TaxID=59557 RepID=A0A292PTM1_9PEZI|nr:unnamed protein product [Tuber aestivum]